MFVQVHNYIYRKIKINVIKYMSRASGGGPMAHMPQPPVINTQSSQMFTTLSCVLKPSKLTIYVTITVSWVVVLNFEANILF